MARAVIPYMRRRGRGRIINVGSWWGYSGPAYFAAYCASKAAMRILTQALADEVAQDGITANALCPGSVNTSMREAALSLEAVERGVTLKEIRAIEWGKIPLCRPGEPADIAHAILYLASDEARYVTGASLDINGAPSTAKVERPPARDDRAAHMAQIEGQYALVTGAGRGIGAACALALAETGAVVIALGRDGDWLGAVAETHRRARRPGHPGGRRRARS